MSPNALQQDRQGLMVCVTGKSKKKNCSVKKQGFFFPCSSFLNNSNTNIVLCMAPFLPKICMAFISCIYERVTSLIHWLPPALEKRVVPSRQQYYTLVWDKVGRQSKSWVKDTGTAIYIVAFFMSMQSRDASGFISPCKTLHETLCYRTSRLGESSSYSYLCFHRV